MKKITLALVTLAALAIAPTTVSAHGPGPYRGWYGPHHYYAPRPSFSFYYSGYRPYVPPPVYPAPYPYPAPYYAYPYPAYSVGVGTPGFGFYIGR